MLVATYAKQIGRAVAFSLAAFRQAFAGGRDLSDPDNVLIAAAACEMHPAAVIKGARLARSGAASTRRPPRRAAAGVLDVPAVRVGERVFHGDRELEAAAALRRLKANREYELSVRTAAAGRRCWPGPTPSTTSRSSRSPPARSRCSGTRSRRRRGGSRAGCAPTSPQLEADAFIAKWRRWQAA